MSDKQEAKLFEMRQPIKILACLHSKPQPTQIPLDTTNQEVARKSWQRLPRGTHTGLLCHCWEPDQSCCKGVQGHRFKLRPFSQKNWSFQLTT